MLATLGLERVESSLRRDAVTPADVDILARSGIDRALHGIHRPVDVRDTPARDFIQPISASGLPTHEYLQHLANTEFRQTRHANRV